MTFRVTPLLFARQAIEHARRHTANLVNLQQQVSTGLRVSKPSDDPAAVRSLLAQKIEVSRIDTQLANIQDARLKLNLSVSQLMEVNSIFVRAQDIALEGNQSNEREVLAREVDELISRLQMVANSKHDGQYIFAGTAVDSAPFVEGANGPGVANTVQYAGSSDRVETAIDSGLWLDVFFSGDEVFQQRSRQQTLFLGQTGAVAGSGTDSAFGQGTLTVRHTSTVYLGVSGVQPGTGSADDTIIGPAGTHVLTVNDTSGTGSNGTVSLNGGAPVAFTSADGNLKITGPLGEAVYVDMTAIAPGFNGTVDIQADGTLSVDGGATTSPITFSGNQVVRDSITGGVTNVDSTNIRRAGTNHLEYTGTADAFQALTELRDDLRNVRNLSESEYHDSMARRIEDLKRVREGILDIVGQQAAELETIDSLERRAQDLQLESQRLISGLESADLSETIVNLQNEQNLLQFTYASSVRLLDQSLLDFLR